jgi:predicted AAA+ superfamily ATPase
VWYFFELSLSKSLEGKNIICYTYCMGKNILDRNVLGEILKALEMEKITFLLGSRQTGKTSLMKLALNHFSNMGYDCFYLDMEDARNLPLFESMDNLESFLRARKVDLKEDKILIGVDEFYVSNSVFKMFKLIRDHHQNVRVIASGSSAVEVKANIEESLAGRVRVIDVFPLSFDESLLFKKNPFLQQLKEEKFVPSELLILNLEKEIKDMVIYGGYPKVNLLKTSTDRIEEIYDIYSTYIQKDIRALLKDDNVIKFSKMIKLLAAQSGQLLNIAAVCKALGTSRKVLEKFLFILEKTFIIYLVNPYSSNVKRTIVKNPKLFFVDTGMLNMASENFTPLEFRQNAGNIFETFVLGEILKHKKKYQSIYFYRTTSGTEIDFIINDLQQGLIPIEVKYKDFETPVVPKAMQEFCKTENVQRAYILNKNLYHEKKQNNTTFIFLPVISLKRIFE